MPRPRTVVQQAKQEGPRGKLAVLRAASTTARLSWRQSQVASRHRVMGWQQSQVLRAIA